MNLKYLFGAIISIPLLPIMYFQGRQIRARVPKLPEATGTEGYSKYDEDNHKTLELITIGESTIAGVGVQNHEEGFTGTLSKRISSLFKTNVHWKVHAKSGYTAREVNNLIIPKIIEKKADIVVVGLGGNDAFTLNRPLKWKADIISLIQSIRQKFPEALIIFCNMPPIKEFPAFTSLIKFTVGNLVEILGDELGKAIQNAENVYYFSEKITLDGWITKFELEDTNDDFFSDGVHPSKLTYQTWATDVANNINESKKIKNYIGRRLI